MYKPSKRRRGAGKIGAKARPLSSDKNSEITDIEKYFCVFLVKNNKNPFTNDKKSAKMYTVKDKGVRHDLEMS